MYESEHRKYLSEINRKLSQESVESTSNPDGNLKDKWLKIQCSHLSHAASDVSVYILESSSSSFAYAKLK